MQKDPVLLLSLTCKDPAGQVSALPWLSPGTRHCRQHLLPSALPNPHTGMGSCPSLCGQTHCSQSHRERQGSASGEEVAASPQSCPGHGLAANPSPIWPPSLHHPLWSLCKAGSAPTVYFCLWFFDLLILQSDSLQILVTILNKNDNSPEFPQPNITRQIPEVRGFGKGRGHCSLSAVGLRKGQQGEDFNPFHTDNNYNDVLFLGYRSGCSHCSPSRSDCYWCWPGDHLLWTHHYSAGEQLWGQTVALKKLDSEEPQLWGEGHCI